MIKSWKDRRALPTGIYDVTKNSSTKLQVFDYHDKLKNVYGTIFDMATVLIIIKWNSKTSSLVQLKKKKNNWSLAEYYGIINDRGGPIFVAFVDNPCPRIYITTDVYKSICLISIKFISNFRTTNNIPTNQKKNVYPTLTPYEQWKISKKNHFCWSRRAVGNMKNKAIESWVRVLWGIFRGNSIENQNKWFYSLL